MIEVKPSDYPPHRCKGSIFIRIGPRTERATRSEERTLIEKGNRLSDRFDAQVNFDIDLDQKNMDLTAFLSTYFPASVDAETIMENDRSMEQKLAGLHFYNLRHNAVTNAGIISFAHDPKFFIPGAFKSRQSPSS